jgi:hypothetical protein
MYEPNPNTVFDISEDLMKFKIKSQNFLYKLRLRKEAMFKPNYFYNRQSEKHNFSDSESSGQITNSDESIILSSSSESEDEYLSDSDTDNSLRIYKCLMNKLKPELCFIDELKFVYAKYNKLPYANEIITRNLNIFFDEDSFIIDKV